MFAKLVFLIFGFLVWIEFLVGVVCCFGKNASYLSAFLSRPFGIPMPSMIFGVIARVLLIAGGSVGIVKFFI